MADYVLTQTGQEVQDILDGAEVGKYLYNKTVSTWSNDNTYPDYPKKGFISAPGVSGADGVEVTFSTADAVSGNYAPVANTVAGGIEIWAKAQSTVTIPTIHITTGGDTTLRGDDAYLPIGGGNITGSLSVDGSPVLTVGSYKIGDVLITSTNTNPATTLGGTWTLIDKEFTPTAGANTWSADIDMENVTSGQFYCCRSGHTVALEFNNVVTSVALSEASVELFTIKYANLGFSRLLTTQRSIFTSDAGNGIDMITIAYNTGVVQSVDVVTKTSGGSIASGSTLSGTIIANVRFNDMADGFCNKFYWKKTA